MLPYKNNVSVGFLPMTHWSQIIYVALGGGLGALSRYTIGNLALHLNLWGQFSAIGGTLVTNIFGCILMGAALASIEHVSQSPNIISPTELTRLKLLLVTGFLGALTTFSTFGADSLYLFNAVSVKSMLLYIFLSNGLGLLGIFATYSIASHYLALNR